jgi:phage RecT family recombinase
MAKNENQNQGQAQNTEANASTAIVRAAQFVTDSRDKLSAYLPARVDRDQFMTSVFLAFDGNADLQAAIASPTGRSSVMSALRLAACKGLSLNPQEGLAGFIPYKGAIQYRVFASGLIALAIRDGHLKEMRTRCIYKNDTLELGEDEHGDTYRLIRSIDDPGEIKGFMAIARLHDNTVRTMYMSAQQVNDWGERYGMRNRDGNLSPMWRDSFEGAGQKTVARQLLTKLHVAIPGIEEPEEEERIAAYVIEAAPEHTGRPARGTSSADVAAALNARTTADAQRNATPPPDPSADPDAPGQQAGETKDGRPF